MKEKTMTANETISQYVLKIKDAKSVDEIQGLTLECLNLLENRKTKDGNKIAFKTFMNYKTAFIEAIKAIEVDSEKIEYKGHQNHPAVTFAYQYNTKQSLDEKEVDKTPTKATCLNAQKLIEIGENLLESDDWKQIGMGVALLTGRRQSEIYFFSKFEADNENTMLVQYLSKKRDNYASKFRIPCLAHSDKIEAAIERMRKCKPMTELYEIVNNSKDMSLSLKLAREKFNNLYSSTILETFNRVIRPHLQDGETENDKDYFHSLRACYASIFYHLCDKKFNCSVEQTQNFIKAALSHDTDGIAQKYLSFKFENLPDVNIFDDSIFSLETIKEVPVIEDKKIEINVSRLLQKIDLNTQEILLKAIQDSDVESAIAKLLLQASKSEMVGSIAKNGCKNVIANLVWSCIKYNESQRHSENPLFVVVTSSFVGNLAKSICLKNIDPKTLRDAIENLDFQIAQSNLELGIENHVGVRKIDGIKQLTNTHLRGAKMVDIVEKIRVIYDSM